VTSREFIYLPTSVWLAYAVCATSVDPWVVPIDPDNFLGVAGTCTTAPKLRLKHSWMLPKSTPPMADPIVCWNVSHSFPERAEYCTL
jgi:hypothetical protein